jgi:hypothetical protein
VIDAANGAPAEAEAVSGMLVASVLSWVRVFCKPVNDALIWPSAEISEL